jgi:hypothetical protein
MIYAVAIAKSLPSRSRASLTVSCHKKTGRIPASRTQILERLGDIHHVKQQKEWRYPLGVGIINLAYLGTVEADVYFVAGSRIQLLQRIVGKLQPILSRLPNEIERVTLAQADNRDALRQQFLAVVEQQVNQADQEPLDIDVAAGESLEIPVLPDPAMTLDQIEGAFRDGTLLPAPAAWRSLDARSYAAEPPGMPACSSIPATGTNSSRRVGRSSRPWPRPASQDQAMATVNGCAGSCRRRAMG